MVTFNGSNQAAADNLYNTASGFGQSAAMTYYVAHLDQMIEKINAARNRRPSIKNNDSKIAKL